MQELVRSALQLMILGMGMTFLSLGALTLGMYLLTAIFRDKGGAELPELDDELPVGEDVSAYREGEFTGDAIAGEEARRRAAAAAVAVALAMTEADERLECPPASRAIQDPWNAFARSLHLSRRTQYEARRFRG